MNITVTPRRSLTKHVLLEVSINGQVSFIPLNYNEALPIDVKFTGLPDYEEGATVIEPDHREPGLRRGDPDW